MDDPRLEKCVITFRGTCHGIGLYHRGENDPHICVMGLCEDDGYWFPSDNGMGSSFWLDEWIQLAQAAQVWMQTHAELDLDDNGNCWGYRFK